MLRTLAPWNFIRAKKFMRKFVTAVTKQAEDSAYDMVHNKVCMYRGEAESLMVR